MFSAPAMKLLTFFLLALDSLVLAASSTSTSVSTSMSMSMTGSAAMSSSTDNSPPYSINSLPLVLSAAPCLQNCLSPIGLADPSGCDDVTENCACLSAPSDVLDFLTDCIQTVCPTSTSLFAASATSLYESYCNSVYGTATFSEAFAEEASAAASSSLASVEATETSHTTAPTPSASATPSKNGGGRWEPALLLGTLAMGGLLVLVVP